MCLRQINEFFSFHFFYSHLRVLFAGAVLIFQKNILVGVLATVGIILVAAYMLWLYRRVVFGKLVNSELKKMGDLNKIEFIIFSLLVFLIFFFGIYPEPLFNTINVSVTDLIINYEMRLK